MIATSKVEVNVKIVLAQKLHKQVIKKFQKRESVFKV